MTTSALAFQQLLQVVSSRAKNNESFLVALSNVLGLAGPESKLEALAVLSRLLGQVRKDLEDLDLDEKSKVHLKAFLAPFGGIESFSQVHMNVDNAKKNFLRPDYLVGLVNVHVALAGRISRFEDREAAEHLAGQIKDALDAIRDSTFDPAIKDLLTKRLLEIMNILYNLQYFGTEKLSRELDALAGAIVLHVPAHKLEENKRPISSIKAIIDGVESLVLRGAEWSKSIGAITDGVTKIGGFAAGLLGLKDG